MSSDADCRRWQHRDLLGLTELVKLGERRKLPPLIWRLSSGCGTLSGTVDILSERHPRAVVEAWCAALAKDSRVEPRATGLHRDGPPRVERTTGDGETRMFAAWEIRVGPVPGARVEFAILANWHETELDPGQRVTTAATA